MFIEDTTPIAALTAAGPKNTHPGKSGRRFGRALDGIVNIILLIALWIK